MYRLRTRLYCAFNRVDSDNLHYTDVGKYIESDEFCTTNSRFSRRFFPYRSFVPKVLSFRLPSTFWKRLDWNLHKSQYKRGKITIVHSNLPVRSTSRRFPSLDSVNNPLTIPVYRLLGHPTDFNHVDRNVFLLDGVPSILGSTMIQSKSNVLHVS